jgi:ferritin-like metal-binding protein YciE
VSPTTLARRRMGSQNCATCRGSTYEALRRGCYQCSREIARKSSKKKENMKLNTLEQLYVSELRDIYSAENQLLKALPKMAKGASSPELKDAFQKHLEQTKGHVERLEELFEQLDESPKGKTCHGMKGLIEEGSELLKEDGEDSVLDAGMIVAAQKVEHYEIASYGSVRTFANLLGRDEEAKLLQSTLDEEAETNEILNQLAESVVNPEAANETELAGAGSNR